MNAIAKHRRKVLVLGGGVSLQVRSCIVRLGKIQDLPRIFLENEIKVFCR